MKDKATILGVLGILAVVGFGLIALGSGSHICQLIFPGGGGVVFGCNTKQDSPDPDSSQNTNDSGTKTSWGPKLKLPPQHPTRLDPRSTNGRDVTNNTSPYRQSDPQLTAPYQAPKNTSPVTSYDPNPAIQPADPSLPRPLPVNLGVLSNYFSIENIEVKSTPDPFSTSGYSNLLTFIARAKYSFQLPIISVIFYDKNGVESGSGFVNFQHYHGFSSWTSGQSDYASIQLLSNISRVEIINPNNEYNPYYQGSNGNAYNPYGSK
jgi:hypothetical protein